MADSYLALSIVYRNLEDWTKGIENAENSIQVSKKIKDKFEKEFKACKAYEEIGSIYEKIQDYSRAIKYFNDAINVIEKVMESLIKEKTNLSSEAFIKNSELSKSLYIEYLKRKIDLLLTLKDEKKAKETVTKPFESYLKTKDMNCLENLVYLAAIKIYLAEKLKTIEDLIRGIGELIILDFFGKSISEDQQYWSNKFHHDLIENSKIMVKKLKLPTDEKALGKETLNILKQIELETKDHMFIDKILELKKSKDYQKNIEELLKLGANIREEEASKVVLSLSENELILSLAQQNEYNEALQKSKEIIKETKKIKNQMVQNFILGTIQLTLFRVYMKRQDYKQAEKEGKKAIEYFDENINTITHAYFATLELASCHIIQNHLEAAELILMNSIEKCEDIGSAEFLARLFELLGDIKLKMGISHDAAVNFGSCALFYLISEDEKRYQEFLTLGINLYNEFLKSNGFEGIKFS